MAQNVVVALLRHADYHQPAGVPSALLPYGLTVAGEEQARAAASELLQFSRLHQMPFVPRIDCSRMRRAYETASIIGGVIGAAGVMAFENADTLKTPGIKVIVGHGASIRHAAVHLGLLGMDEVTGLSMYHARPIYIVRTAQGFKQIAGDWKVRAGSQGGDEVRE